MTRILGRGALPVVLGGEHSVTIGAVEGRDGLDEERVIWAHDIAAARAQADTAWTDRAIDGLVDDAP